MPDQKLRRMVDLNVREVSLVDRPAIRRQFLVVKSEDDRTTAGDHEKEIITLIEKSCDFVDVSKSMPQELTDAINEVLPMLRRMSAQLDDDGKVALARVAGLLDQIQGGAMPIPKEDETKNPMKEGAEKAAPPAPQMTEDEEKKRKEKEAAEAKAKEKEAPPTPMDQKKEKALALDDEPMMGMYADGTIRPIQKRASVQKAMDDLEKVASDAMKAIKEAGGEEKAMAALKGIAADIFGKKTPELPDTANISTSGVAMQGVGDKPVTKALESVAGTLEAVMKRLDSLESVRPVSKGLGDGPLDKPVKKAAEGFWKGAL